ncbi:MAG: T9SS type A sorting domain-containing protein, partial [Bacteroidetes bacterium]|nr:T9SS type A sorting domain-containing protein [Bacteroidota bacterium]
IYRNELDQSNGDANWIQIWLEGTTSARTPIGAQIILVNTDTTGGFWWRQAREYRNDPFKGYMEHFGLRHRTVVDSIIVLWPSGMRDTLLNVPANQRLVIREGDTYTGINDYSRPETYTLGQNYPNPFNPQTTIAYSIGQPGIYELSVYNLMGQRIRILENRYHPAGRYSVTFHAEGLASGMYFYRLSSETASQTRLVK